MFAEYLRQTYLENQIASAKARMCDTDVRLKTVKAPTYVVACEKDHIVPWQASYVGSKLLGGKVRFVLAAGGHIAGIVNPPAAAKGWRLTVPAKSALSETAEKWRATAKNRKAAGGMMVAMVGYAFGREYYGDEKNSATPVMRPLKMRLVLMCALSCRMRERLMLAT